jgi:cell division transport system permease protein
MVDTMIIYKLGKHFKTAIHGLFRNFWMSFSAATAVTITLILVSTFTVLATNIDSFINSVENNITIRAGVEDDYPDNLVYNEQTKEDRLGDEIRKIPGVKTVTFSSKDKELDKFIASMGDKGKSLERLRKSNPMTHVYYVVLKEGQSFKNISDQIKKIEGIKNANYGTGSVQKLVKIFDRVSVILLMFMVALVVLAVFLISNTIKLTIYARKTEIQIMRLCGASNGYIRFPYILEGIIIGIFGSIIPIVLTLTLYGKFLEQYSSGFVSSSLQLASMDQIKGVALMLLIMGALVGMIGSTISVSRYLKA